MTQASTDPTDTAHLRAGPRITLDELATELAAVAVWIRQIAVAAERPSIPIELAEICTGLEHSAQGIQQKAETIAQVAQIIADDLELQPYFGAGTGRQPWGLRAHGSPRDKYGKRLSTVLTHWQILHLANPSRLDSPWRDDEPGGLTYLDGIAGLPELERWESKRAAERRAAQRQADIAALTRALACGSCGAQGGKECRTNTGRLAEQSHRPRINAASSAYQRGDRVIDGVLQKAGIDV